MNILKNIKQFFIKIYRVISQAIRAFILNEDYLKASALTFYTLMSIVPFLAVSFGLAAGFGFEEFFEEELKQAFEEQSEAISYAIKFAHSTLKTLRGGVITGIGLIALLWTNLSLFSSIENALNDIWKVRQPRSWVKKITDYLAVMVICPVFFVVSSSLSIFIATQVTEAKDITVVKIVSPFLLFLLKLTPYILSALLFIVIYLFIPNVRLHPRPRIIAGILAGFAFQFWQWLYLKFQVSISTYGAIYGTFAALPLFLIWLQVSWLIVLAGAEIAAQLENELSNIAVRGSKHYREASQKVLGLLILQQCIKTFTTGEQPMTALAIARNLGIPLLTAQEMIELLIESNILVEVTIRDSSSIGYAPSKEPSLFTIKNVCDAIEKQIEWRVPIDNSRMLETVVRSFKEFDRLVKESPENLDLATLNQQS